MTASAKEPRCRPGAQDHSGENKAILFFMLAIRIARTWIQGLSDLVEVLLATPLRTNIVIILPVRKHIASGKVHLGVRTPFGGRKSATSKCSFLGSMCAHALWGQMKQPLGSGFARRKAGLTNRGTFTLGAGVYKLAKWVLNSASQGRCTTVHPGV
jgi:hypothetical protein